MKPKKVSDVSSRRLPSRRAKKLNTSMADSVDSLGSDNDSNDEEEEEDKPKPIKEKKITGNKRMSSEPVSLEKASVNGVCRRDNNEEKEEEKKGLRDIQSVLLASDEDDIEGSKGKEECDSDSSEELQSFRGSKKSRRRQSVAATNA